MRSRAWTQYRGVPLSQPLEIAVTLYFKNKLRRDWDNWHKLSMDALTGIVWDDDSRIVDATVRKRIDKARPRIEITPNERTPVGGSVARG